MMIDVPVEGSRWIRTEYELSSWPGLLNVLAQNMQIGNEGALKFLRGYLKIKKPLGPVTFTLRCIFQKISFVG
jgi:hypothetical protein